MPNDAKNAAAVSQDPASLHGGTVGGLTRGCISDEGRGGAYLKLLFKHVGSDDNKIPHQYRCCGDFLV